MAAKRPFNALPQNPSNFIDLTSDTEDERPAKRHRSLSNAPTLAPPKTNQLNSLLSSLASHNSTPRNTIKASQAARAQSGRVTKGSSTPSEQNGNSLPADIVLLSDDVNNDSQYSAQSQQKPKSLANGMTNLSLRPSPRPTGRTYGRQPPTGNLKDSRVTTLITRETEFEHTASKTRTQKKAAGRSSSSESPTRQDEAINLEDWIQPEAKPLVFDTTSHNSPMYTGQASSQLSTKSQRSLNGSSKAIELAATSRRGQSPTSLHVKSSPKTIKINVPPTPAQTEAKRKAIMKKLKSDVTYIKTNPAEVATATGVAPFDNTDLDDEICHKARQKKFKTKVDRQSIKLDLGVPFVPPVKTERPAAVEMVHPRKQARRILTERFKQPQAGSLTFENRRNERYLSGKFQFVSNYVLSRKALLRKPTFLPPRICQCQHESCDANCLCTVMREVVDGKIMQSHITRPAYQRLPNDLIVLSSEFLDTWSEKLRVLFECTNDCKCSAMCNNRVVQKGRTIPLQIFETVHCGFGVSTLSNLVRGQFIDVYLGEVLTTAEVEKREDTVEEDTPSYLMSLDVFIADTNSGFHIDGANFGSVTRFVNHSCEPNAKTIPVVLSDSTKHLYHVAFFAIKDIAAGTEITIDYNPDLEQDEDEITDSAIVQCRCGSANCRKRLWKPGKEKRGRKRILPAKDD